VRGFLGIFALLSLAGCPGGRGADAGAMAVELGTGSLDFVSIAPEGDLELHAGPQGGHHFIVDARAAGLVPGDPEQPGQEGNPSTLFKAFNEAGTQIDVMYPPYVLGYADTGDGWYTLPSGRILQVAEDYVPDLIGQRVRITVDVEDVVGAAGADERWIHVIAELSPPDGADAGVDAAP
jgi:hypothetical protein